MLFIRCDYFSSVPCLNCSLFFRRPLISAQHAIRCVNSIACYLFFLFLSCSYFDCGSLFDLILMSYLRRLTLLCFDLNNILSVETVVSCYLVLFFCEYSTFSEIIYCSKMSLLASSIKKIPFYSEKTLYYLSDS